MDDDDVTGDVHERRKSFGEIASSYLSPYIHKRGVVDTEYGLRKIGDKFFMGNTDVTVDTVTSI
jgi:hypothetical protein